MGHYKGIEAADDVAPLMRHMAGVDATREALQGLQGVWDTLTLLGELSGAGVEIGSLRSAFADLSGPLLNQLARQARQKALLQLRTKAQVAIDILVRNLFERTADIGFLATDDDLLALHAAEPAERAAMCPAIVRRLEAYGANYSVYDDIVLTDAQGHVLVSLQPHASGTTKDALVTAALESRAPYLETFAESDLRPGAGRTLVYSCSLGGPSARLPAVLSLHFRFADECRRIFDALARDEWTVLTLVDADSVVIATSDAVQVPLGASLKRGQAQGGKSIARFGGRLWLAVTCEAHAYQGYAGPGWCATAMVPVDQAFDVPPDAAAAAASIPAETLQSMLDSPLLFGKELRGIPVAAEQIEVELNRAVWNGSVADARQGNAGTAGTAGPAGNAAFSKALLREITKTGTRTREVFTRAIAEMNQTVVSSTFEDVSARAALAIDILDRNLYERANDCRWWALTSSFRSALAGNGAVDATTQASLQRTLRTIHGLYTVYANLVLFDRNGRIVAAAVDSEATTAGRQLPHEWVRRTLGLSDSRSYVVSTFTASELYDDRPTLIYAAAIREPTRDHGRDQGGDIGRAEAVVGGIAIVFDTAPQLRAMLSDVLPHGPDGALKDGDCAAYVDRQGAPIAVCAGDGEDPAEVLARVGRLDMAALCATAADGAPLAQVVTSGGRIYGVGACRSAGYREYRASIGAAHDGDRAGAVAVVMRLLTVADRAAVAPRLPPPVRLAPPRGVQRATGDRIELATFSIGGLWFALPTAQLREAVGIARVLPMPGAAPYLRGSAMVRGEPTAVLDLLPLLNAGALTDGPPAGGVPQMVVVLPGHGQPPFGIQVDTLGHTEEVDAGQLEPIGPMGARNGSLVDHIVKPTPGRQGDTLLMVLSLTRLAQLVAPAPASAPTPQSMENAATVGSATRAALLSH